MSLLEVKDLTVGFPTADGLVQAVRGLSFSVDPGRTLAIVGESGSGKTVSTQAILGLLPEADISGSVLFEGVDLLALDEERLRRIRGAEISVIFQDPLTSLHPLYKIGWQIGELIHVHDASVSRAQARRRAIELLGLVGIPKPERRVDDYPHQFSGGMRQRAMIAMALALNPKLVVADEPTTALDATVQAQILELISRLQREFDIALVLITHDLGVVAGVADEVMVMYAGLPVERADRRTLYYRPHHPYTKGLLESIPGSTGAREGRLRPIPGQPPSMIAVPAGCAFHPRCRYAMPVCAAERPPLARVTGDGDHASACWLPHQAIGHDQEAEAARLRAAEASPSERP
ncbi:ABC transporter ATP-binding protein [Sphaerisporangium krabiense]|uniref:Oligopeptide/dipeptide ABC transporter ATP-binding protein n=1 Tax=Sphaerisporangium krabiense TaxID=763782 RepID=A0A7W8YZM4_9ACTN|nr:ABC transporter ATP-binding protein [Sphaerisporangium krabiense]MBB5624647.1 oligopeptide/dipeptide ABC transporter ATP-binding protein [Sphaerisporangium krabiense]GII61396.1 ABC transporter ATP-binding protein [Sphaerisporangium krabiense]